MHKNNIKIKLGKGSTFISIEIKHFSYEISEATIFVLTHQQIENHGNNISEHFINNI